MVQRRDGSLYETNTNTLVRWEKSIATGNCIILSSDRENGMGDRRWDCVPAWPSQRSSLPVSAVIETTAV